MLRVADPPHSSSLTIITARDRRWMRLTSSTLAIHPDGHGLSTWQLTRNPSRTALPPTTSTSPSAITEFAGPSDIALGVVHRPSPSHGDIAAPPPPGSGASSPSSLTSCSTPPPEARVTPITPQHRLTAADTRPEHSQPSDADDLATSTGRPTPAPGPQLLARVLPLTLPLEHVVWDPRHARDVAHTPTSLPGARLGRRHVRGAGFN